MYQEPAFLKVHTWRNLMVPQQILTGLGHYWPHGSPFLTSLIVIISNS